MVFEVEMSRFEIMALLGENSYEDVPLSATDETFTRCLKKEGICKVLPGKVEVSLQDFRLKTMEGVGMRNINAIGKITVPLSVKMEDGLLATTIVVSVVGQGQKSEVSITKLIETAIGKS